MAQKKYSSCRQSSKTKPSTKLVLVSREPLLYLEFNKPNKQNVYGINSNHLINSAFLSLKIIVDTLTDVGNAKHQNINITLLSDVNVPVGFRAVAASKVQLSSAQGQLHRSSMVSLTLFQTDLRIPEHRGHKFSPSLTLLSAQNSNRMASRLTTIASFSAH